MHRRFGLCVIDPNWGHAWLSHALASVISPAAQKVKKCIVYTEWTYTLWPPLSLICGRSIWNLDWTLPWHWRVLVPKCGPDRACSIIGNQRIILRLRCLQNIGRSNGAKVPSHRKRRSRKTYVGQKCCKFLPVERSAIMGTCCYPYK